MGRNSAFSDEEQKDLIRQWDQAGSENDRAKILSGAGIAKSTLDRWRARRASSKHDPALQVPANTIQRSKSDEPRKLQTERWTSYEEGILTRWIAQEQEGDDPLTGDGFFLLLQVKSALRFRANPDEARIDAVTQRAMELMDDLVVGGSSASIAERASLAVGFINVNAPDYFGKITGLRPNSESSPTTLPTSKEKAHMRAVVSQCPDSLLNCYREAVAMHKALLKKGTSAAGDDPEWAKKRASFVGR